MNAITPITQAYRSTFEEHVGVFTARSGEAIAIDRRVVGMLRAGTERGVTVVSLKLPGVKAIPIAADFAQLHKWWTAPAQPKETGNET